MKVYVQNVIPNDINKYKKNSKIWWHAFSNYIYYIPTIYYIQCTSINFMSGALDWMTVIQRVLFKTFQIVYKN